MKKSCIRYYGGKLLAFVVSVLVLSVLVFYIARLAPGDPLVSAPSALGRRKSSV